MENSMVLGSRTSERTWSWAQWRGLPKEERWSALAELCRLPAVCTWAAAVKWFDEAIDEFVQRAKEEVSDEKKWPEILKEAYRISKSDKDSWYRWRRLSPSTKEKRLYRRGRFGDERFSYDHAASCLSNAIDNVELTLRAAKSNVDLKREGRG
jgi:hypothetical protein